LRSASSSICNCIIRRRNFVQLGRHGIVLDAQPAGGLVDQIDRLVRQETVLMYRSLSTAAETIAPSVMRTP
jgi:hypothetical protein